MADEYQNKRVERSKAAVLAETYRQLTQGGMTGVSVDDVARESGVAKTTIYRHWPTRSALLIDACSRMGGPQPTPNLGSLRGDLLMLAQTVADQLRTAPWAAALPSIIDAAERDAKIAAMQTAMHRQNVEPFRGAVENARARGDVSPDASADLLTALTLGPLFYRRWFSKEPLDDAFVDAVVDTAIGTVSPPAPLSKTAGKRRGASARHREE